MKLEFHHPYDFVNSNGTQFPRRGYGIQFHSGQFLRNPDVDKGKIYVQSSDIIYLHLSCNKW